MNCHEFTVCHLMNVVFLESGTMTYVLMSSMNPIATSSDAGSWTQLIYYAFDCPMTKETLFTLIEKAEAVGLPGVAMVTDLCPKNIKLWKSLGITTKAVVSLFQLLLTDMFMCLVKDVWLMVLM